MMDDTTVSVLVVILAGIGFLLGRIQDPLWRCLMLRRFTKKNYIVVNARNQGMRLTTSFVVNAENGELHIGNNAWVLGKGRIYLKNNERFGFSLTKEVAHAESLGLEGAVPIVYVDTNDVKPLFFQGDEAAVSAGEYAANGKKYLANEKAKIMAQQNVSNIITYLILLLALVAAGASFMTFDKMNQQEKAAQAGAPVSPEANQTAHAQAAYIGNPQLSAEMPYFSDYEGVSIYG